MYYVGCTALKIVRLNLAHTSKYTCKTPKNSLGVVPSESFFLKYYSKNASTCSMYHFNNEILKRTLIGATLLPSSNPQLIAPFLSNPPFLGPS